MPIEDLPTPMDEFQKSPSASESSNSLDNVPSISSSSSNSVGGGSGGRVGGGGGDTNHRRPNDRHFEYVPAVQPLIMQREPSLDELLVNAFVPKFCCAVFTARNYFLFPIPIA